MQSLKLSQTSGMPGRSLNMGEAGATCPGALISIKRDGPRSVCANCKMAPRNSKVGQEYFKRGKVNRMNMGNVMALTDHNWSLLRGRSVLEMCSLLVDAMRRVDGYMRTSDRGDIFSADCAKAWRLSIDYLQRREGWETKVWIPTKSWLVPAILPELVRLNALPNVSVSPSTSRVGDPPVVVSGLDGGKAVGYNGCFQCPAYINGKRHSCDDAFDGAGCRACWEGKEVSFHYS